MWVFLYLNMHERRKIRLIEGNAKCRHLKKVTSKGTLRQVFICLRPRTAYPPSPLHTVYCTRTVHLFTQGRGEGRELNQREGERGNRGEYRSQSWVDNTNMTECTQETGYLQSINSDKHLSQSPFIGQFFR